MKEQKGDGYRLPETDVRHLVRLLGETCVQSGGLPEKRRFLMQGLSSLTAADRWIWVRLPLLSPGEKVMPTGLIHGGFSQEEFSKYLQVIEHPDLAEMNAPFLELVAHDVGEQHTRLQEQLDPENRFQSLDVFPLWADAGLGSVMLSARRIKNQGVSFVGMYRKPGEPPFGHREARLAHVVLSEVSWLHEGKSDDIALIHHDSLSPRKRQVLNFLLEGQSRKQIHNHLGISSHTLSGYIKEIYRTYGVHSQAALMRYFQSGNGGDLPP